MSLAPSGRALERVIVIGLDGLEPTLVAPMLAAGSLPNLARLAAQGGFGTVATTAPAQTPVAWSTFATGLNPGGHGIFDFIRRDPASYRPDLALNRYEPGRGWLPPKAVNLRRGVAVWDRLAAAGIPSSILRCPCTYPPALDQGRMLSGMGVPDLRGGLGTPTLYTTDRAEIARESESVVHLAGSTDGPITTHLIGPRNPKDGTALQCPIELVPDRAAGRVTIRLPGATDGLVVGRRCWSDWLPVRFKAGALSVVRGLVRFFLLELGERLELYASPINFDPDQPLFPISSPAGFARELSGAIGPYATTGMVEDHTGLNNERLDETAFLQQCDDAWYERESMLRYELSRFERGLFYCLFDTPDRVQHLFWRYGEPEHPANRGQTPSAEFAGVIAEQYRKADAMVGLALEAADDRTLVIALSDHGFGSFQRGVNLNAWLHQQGLLVLRDIAEPGREPFRSPADIDWSRTQAYALGLGGIYLNQQGREAQGIVAPDEAEAVAGRIARALEGLVDPERGQLAIRGVRTRRQLYHGPYARESPDLVVQCERGYRVGWGDSLGGVSDVVFEDNRKKWSGDHIVDPALVPGVLFLNRPFRPEGARLLDLAPTILEALGVPVAAELEGSSLLS